MTVYQISGLGAGAEVYSTIGLDAEVVFLPWLEPKKNESMGEYASRMASSIDREQEHCLMGVSFGGIMAQEIARITKPKRVYLISTVIDPNEIPPPLKLAVKAGAHNLIPNGSLDWIPFLVHLSFGANKEDEKEFLNNIMKNISYDYLRWAIGQIGSWKNPAPQKNLVRFHGKQDLQFPAIFQKGVDHWFKGGHFISVQKGPSIAKIINMDLQSYHTN